MSEASDHSLAELLIAQGLVTRDQARECLALLDRRREEGGRPTPRLAEILREKGYLSEDSYEKTARPAARPSGPQDGTPPEVQAASVDPAASVGKFVRVSRLGRGGMGEVWKAWDRSLGRYVALKLLLGHDPEGEARLLAEAQVVARLSHPHIAPVYESGRHDGRAYIAMQLIEGTTVGKAKLSLEESLLAVRDAAEALDYAHGRGVIHRDVKPENLMVSGRHVFVMDFGLARQTRVDGPLSRSGVVVGTPHYMSPEQARGESRRLDARTDVYALGATLYTLLAGRVPHEGSDLLEILRKVDTEDPPPPRRLNRAVPDEVETILLKAMEKEPERRYATARELAEDLRRYLDGEPIAARRASVLYRLKKGLLKRKAAAVVGAVGLAAILVVGGVLLERWRSERAGRESEARRFRAREDDLRELAALWGQVALEKRDLHIAGSDPAKVVERIREAIGRVGDFLRRQPDLPQAWYVRGMGRLFLDDLRGAEADFREALRRDPGFVPGMTLLARVQIEDHVDRASAGEEAFFPVNAGATALLEAGRLLEEARRAGAGKASISQWGLPKLREDVVTEELAGALAAIYIDPEISDFRYDGARRLLRAALEKEDAAEFYHWLGILAPSPAEKAEFQTKALERMAHYPRALVERGVARLDGDDPAGAIEDFSRALRVNPRCAAAWRNRGLARLERGEPREAAEDFGRALDLEPGSAALWRLRGCAWIDGDEPDRAVGDLGRAICLAPDEARAWSDRSLAHRKRGDFDAAFQDVQKAIDLDPGCAVAYVNRGELHLRAGRLREALADGAKAAEAAPGRPGGRILCALARMLLAEREPGRARELLDAAVRDVEEDLRRAPPHWPKRATAEKLLEDLREKRRRS